MAKIKGIELTEIKTMQTLGGVTLSANINFQDKVVGSIFDDGSETGLMFKFESKGIKDEVKDLILQYYKENPSYIDVSIESEEYESQRMIEFVSELMFLYSTENLYKLNQSEGFPVTAVLNTQRRDEVPYTNETQMVKLKEYNDDVKANIQKIAPRFKEILVYQSIDDFIMI